MKKVLLTLVFCFIFLNPLWALFCDACGKQLPGQVRFCPFCGIQQKVQSQVPQPTPAQPALPRMNPPISPPVGLNQPGRPSSESATEMVLSAKGSLTNEKFLSLLKPLDAFEYYLSESQRKSPNCRTVLQRQLLPGLETLKKKINERQIKLTKPQAKLIALYKDRYSSILDESVGMGYQKEIFNEKVEQLAVLVDFLRRSLDQDNLNALEKIEESYMKELQNIEERTVNLNDKAGFENPGVCYKIRKEDFSGDVKNISFTFNLQKMLGKKFGERVHVFDASGIKLGQLVFANDEGGVRVYKGSLNMSLCPGRLCRGIKVEYALKTSFAPKWEKQKFVLFLVPPVSKEEPVDYTLESTCGYAPAHSRKRYLTSIGKY